MVEIANRSKEIMIGYVRVSTIEDRQKLGFEAQKRILIDNKVSKIYSEKISGRKDDRPEFEKAINRCKKLKRMGIQVTFVVVKLDRVSRKMSSLLNILEDLKANENVDTSSPTGILMMQLLAMFSEFEVNTLRTRTKEALHQAKLDGKILGRPSFNEKKREKIAELYRNPDLSVKEVAVMCQVSQRTVFRVAKENNLSRTFAKGSSFIE